jgi:aarF domain-containing kinase
VANRILEISKENKGIYLKLGQYIGNLEKVVPWEFTEVLKVLQDSAPQIPFEEIKITLESDLNQKLEDVFSYLDTHAIAAASLAQVHRAILKGTDKYSL